MRWRFVTVLAGFAIFAGSVVLSSLLPSGFLPENDTSRSILKLDATGGGSEAVEAKHRARHGDAGETSWQACAESPADTEGQ